MPTPELNANNENISMVERSLEVSAEIKTINGAQKKILSFNVLREIEIIFGETIVTAIFILSDMFIIWLIGLAFADTINQIPFISFLYDGIKIVSAFIIGVRYLSNCILEINQAKKKVLLELKEKALERN